MSILSPAKQAMASFLGIETDEYITDEMAEWMRNKIREEINKGNYSGGLDYDDYGMGDGRGNLRTMFPASGLLSPEMGWGNTLGRADWAVDKETGDLEFTGGTDFNFRSGAYGTLGDIINKGGLFGNKTQHFNPKLNIY